MLPSHGRDRGFEPRRERQKNNPTFMLILSLWQTEDQHHHHVHHLGKTDLKVRVRKERERDQHDRTRERHVHERLVQEEPQQLEHVQLRQYARHYVRCERVQQGDKEIKDKSLQMT